MVVHHGHDYQQVCLWLPDSPEANELKVCILSVCNLHPWTCHPLKLFMKTFSHQVWLKKIDFLIKREI